MAESRVPISGMAARRPAGCVLAWVRAGCSWQQRVVWSGAHDGIGFRLAACSVSRLTVTVGEAMATVAMKSTAVTERKFMLIGGLTRRIVKRKVQS